MGCDIHLYVEKQHKGKWVMVNEVSYDAPACNRNYRRFAALAGVRGDGPPARGLPADVSESVNFHADEDGADGHSHSWMPVKEALPIFQAKLYPDEPDDPNPNARQYPAYHFFGIDDEEALDEYRIVFWFDN